jgi:DNA invertase Pin-like site-specific DNA recombinase
MQRYPIAYLRRSSADATDPGDVSREAQEAAVRELARRDGYTGDVRTLTDWDRSADEAKEGRRAGFLAMLAAIERGECDVVYSASLDRLYRSMRTFVRLTDAAKAHDVRIVTLREGVLGGDGSPMAQAFAEITAVFSGLELRTTKARAAGALAVRRERGDHIGRVGYGYQLARNDAGAIVAAPDPTRPLGPIVDAVRDGGSILAGCKLLRLRGIPAPDGGMMWGSTTLRRIIERAAPELIPAVGPTGRRQPTHAALAQLLVCHCGHVLTPEGRRKWGRVAYRCTRGNRLGRDVHGPCWVAEASVLPWVRDELARLRLVDPETGEPIDAVTLAADNAAQRDALAGRLDRANEMYVLGPKAGGWTRERRDAEAAAVAAELERLGDAEATLGVSPIRPEEWDTWTPADLGSYIRAILRSVTLGPDMRPLEALWRNRKLRRA